MSLSDKYGGNNNIDDKYSYPKPKIKKVIDFNRCPYINPGYELNYQKLPSDIRVEKKLKINYMNLLLDARKYINLKLCKTAKEAFYNDRMCDFHMQVYSLDHLNILLAPLYLTNSVSMYGCDLDELVDRFEAERIFKKYDALNNDKQAYVKFEINTGTFTKYFDELYTDIDTTNIYYFNDGHIYCCGEEFLYNVPIDYLSKVLDESITELNKGKTPYYIPTMRANIIYKYSLNVEPIQKNRQYIIKRHIGY